MLSHTFISGDSPITAIEFSYDDKFILVSTKFEIKLFKYSDKVSIANVVDYAFVKGLIYWSTVFHDATKTTEISSAIWIHHSMKKDWIIAGGHNFFLSAWVT